MSDNNDFTHEFVVYNSDNNNGTQGTGKFLLYDDNINALKVESIDNIKIGGGEEGQVLITDGEGNLTWATSSGGGGVAVNADWNSSSGASRILNKPDLSVYLPKSGGTLTGKLNAAQGAGTTGGYSFGGTEGSNDTGMFSNADGVLDFYANAVKIVTVTTGGVTSTQAITLPSNPTSNLQAATKQYVDSSVSALNNFSGNYNDLTNKPTVATSAYIGTTQVAFNRSSGALTLAGVSIDGNAATVSNGVYTNGSYANPAWITSLAYSKLTDAPDLATVATSGSYDDLTNKPSLATVATSGSYSDLTNRPTIFSGAYADLTGKPTLFDGAYLSLTGLPNLAAVATSGSYNDLSNKPTIPSLTGYATEAWVNSQGFGSGSFTGSYNDLTNKPNLFSGNYNDLTNKPSIPSVPTDVSAFNNDSGYITSSALSGYATESWVTSQGYGSGSGGQTFDQNLNTTDNVTFTGITLDGNITSSNGSEFITQNGSGGSIDIYTDWTGNGVEVWLQHGDRVAIKTENGTYAWDFDNAGKLTLPELGQGLGWINSDSAPTPDTGFLYSSTISFDKNQGIVLTNNVAGTDISWVIGKDGKLKLPAGGDIVDSNGNSVLGGSSGTPTMISSGLTAPGSAVVANETNVSVNFSDGGSGTFVFKANGQLQLASGGDIVDSNGNSVLGGGVSTGDITFDGVKVIGAETNRGGGSIELVPNNGYYGDGQYLNIYPTNAQDAPHIHLAAGTGGDLILGDDNSHVDVNHNGYVRIRSYDSGTSNSYQWRFHYDGNLQLPGAGAIEHNGSYTRTSTSWFQGTDASGVVWTGTRDLVSGVKLTIQTQSPEVGDSSGSHFQTCEAIIASRGVAASGYGVGEPVMTVYGVTHTSTAPLATFSVQRNATTKLIEIVATRTAATDSGIDFRIHSVEMIAID
jgi:hypothetical protein